MSTKVDYTSTELPDDLESSFESALGRLRGEDPPIEEHIIGGSRRTDGVTFERFDPCQPGVRVSAAHSAPTELVSEAVSQAREVFKVWRRTTVEERCNLLLQAADRIDDDIAGLSAILSAETGKTRLEAIGEVQEASDIIRHYTRLMLENHGYDNVMKTSPTEDTFDVLVPYGVFGVIGPFNFPFALPTGMMVGALVSGNTVVCKPSDKTPRSTAAIAAILADLLPAGVVNLVHGGADIGRALAETDVDGIAFTGSAEVGWQLIAGTTPAGLPRPVLAEMGGQNPAVVGASADLDAAASGIVRSAFGLSGQKCSACRRVVVVRDVADELAATIVAKAEELVIGDPVNKDTYMGPVIDGHIAARIDEALQTAAADGRVLTGRRLDRDGNWFAPVVVAGLPIGHALTREELFGPFLTITEVDTFDDALAEANDVPYGLTAGVFSRDEAEIDQFVEQIEAGVIYVNRAAGATTGAWPGVQSFCGWKRSGSMGKGGLGHWYLQGFMREQSRTIAKNPSCAKNPS
jgi:1-pyrroline-5-carboxylate dehydrogenase